MMFLDGRIINVSIVWLFDEVDATDVLLFFRCFRHPHFRRNGHRPIQSLMHSFIHSFFLHSFIFPLSLSLSLPPSTHFHWWKPRAKWRQKFNCFHWYCIFNPIYTWMRVKVIQSIITWSLIFEIICSLKMSVIALISDR